MKLTRKQQKEENEALDLFVSFGSDFIAALKAGSKPDLTEKQRKVFSNVQNRLTRCALLKSGISRGDKQIAVELKDATVFQKIAQKGATKLNENEIEQIRRAYIVIYTLRELAKERAENLALARDELEKRIETDEEAAERLTQTRAQNAEIMRSKRTEDDLRRGGVKGGPARAKSLTREARQKIASTGGKLGKRGKAKPKIKDVVDKD